MAVDAQSRRRRAQVFFLATGDRRAALRTQDLDEEAWAEALRLHIRARVPALDLPEPRELGSKPDAVRNAEWIEQAFCQLNPEQRACIALPALLGGGVRQLAVTLAWSMPFATDRYAQTESALRHRLSEADADQASSNESTLDGPSLGGLLAEFAERGLHGEQPPIPQRPTRSRARKLAFVFVFGLVVGLATLAGVALRANAPRGITWNNDSASEFENGRLRSIGRGIALEADWSPDGSRIVIAATTGLYSLDAADLHPVALARLARAPKLLGFSPDSSRFAAWEDGALTVRDAVSFQPVFTAASESWRGATAVAWNWSTGALALGANDGLRMLWPGRDLNERTWPAIADATHLRFSQDGVWLAVTTATPAAFALDLRSGASLALGGASYAPSGIAFSQDSTRLAGIHEFGVEVASLIRREKSDLYWNSGLMRTAWWTADGARLIVVEANDNALASSIVTLDATSGAEVRRLTLPGDGFAGAGAVRSDGARAITIDLDGLTVWNLESGSLVAASADFAPLRPSPRPYPLAFGPEGRWLAAPGTNGGVRLVDAATGRLLRTLDDNNERFVEIAVGQDGHLIAANNGESVAYRPAAPGEQSRSRDAAVYVFDTESGQITHVFPGARQPQFVLPGGLLYIPPEGTEIRQYEFDSGANRALAGVIGRGPEAYASLANGSRIALLTDRALELWDPATAMIWAAPLVRRGMDRSLSGSPLAISPEARFVAIAEPGLGIRIYAGETGALRGILARPITVSYEASNENPLKIAISPDGRWIATVDNRPTPANTASSILMVWRSDTLRPVETRSGYSEKVTGIAFSPDSRRLALIRADFVIEMIDLP